MDPALRAGPDFLNSVLTVRRPTAIARSGSTETLGPAVALPAYKEDSYGFNGKERVTDHVYVVDHADLVAAGMADLRDTDRFWADGKDATKEQFGVKAQRIEAFRDPTLAGVVSHWEVRL